MVDGCERKILFWQDVNSDSVSWLVSQPAGLKPAEHDLGLKDSSRKVVVICAISYFLVYI